jgi:CspA family cold shock protein
MVMQTGRVIRFDEAKGYGFIAPSEGGEDVFVHANEVSDRGLRISAGTQVEFRVLEGDRGLKAYDVRVLDEEQQPGPAPAAHDMPARNGGLRAEQEPKEQIAADDELIEVFSEREFVQQITDLLLTTAPQLPGATILELRGALLRFAHKNGWVE